MTTTTTIIGISGSLRAKSVNSALLRAAAEVMPEGSALQTCSIAGVPFYDGDVEESSGVPVAVSDIKERIAAAAGLLLVTPEYNHSVPGVLKNAIDWLSRPAADIPRVFWGKPVAIIGASPGGFGTIQAQTAWLPVIRFLRMRPWFDSRILLAHAGAVFDDAGVLTDEKTRAQLRDFMRDFTQFASKRG